MTWASSLNAYKRIAPNMLLYYRFMERAIDAGIATFNFGRTSPNSGTHKFKLQWGARDEQLWWYDRAASDDVKTPSPTDSGYAWGPAHLEASSHLRRDDARSRGSCATSLDRPAPASSQLDDHGALARARARPPARTSARALEAELRHAFGASDVVLVDSGTSALAMALRVVDARRAASSRFPRTRASTSVPRRSDARVRVRLYDRGSGHALRRSRFGVARARGRGRHDRRLASLRLSCRCSRRRGARRRAWRGRDRGRGAGRVGLAARHATRRVRPARGAELRAREGDDGRRRRCVALRSASELPDALTAASARVAAPASSLRTLVVTTAQWALGRPALYALPSAIPALHLGETIYHPAHEPRSITSASASLVRAALARASDDLAVRRRHAEVLELGGAERARRSVPFGRSRARSPATCASPCDSRTRAREIASSRRSASCTVIRIRSPISPSCDHRSSATSSCRGRASFSARS